MKRAIVILILLFPLIAFAQQNNTHVTFIAKDSLYREVEKNWRFYNGDSAVMSSPGYDDSKWQITPPEMYNTSEGSKNRLHFTGIAWFRLHFIADTSIVNEPLVFLITHYGASEIYLDGKLVTKFGKIKGKDSSEYYDPQSIPVVLPMTAGEHVLAIRYANYDAEVNSNKYHKEFAGFKFLLAPADDMMEFSRRQAIDVTFVLTLLIGIFLSLSMLHLFMYLYQRSGWSNLYFSVFCFCLSVLLILPLITKYSSTPSLVMKTGVLLFFVVSGAFISLSGFSNELFSKKKLRFRVFAAACIILPFIWYISAEVLGVLFTVLLSYVLIESVVLTVRGIYKKVPGARIIGFGILFFALFFLTITALALTMDQVNINDSTLAGKIGEIFAAGAILSIPVSISIYLAWNFANINKDLKSQLDQVQVLSERSLAQEQEKKLMLERQNTELEQKVAERTQEVMHQKEVIEIKNRAITDNLIYAQRIQSAILPDINMIYKALAQSFILYLPKDIVSGDFYAFAEKNGRVLIIAGDCTGHGVSGAFMSMIGGSLLNQIINEKGIIKPAGILEELNSAIIETFRQNESESNDGMDVSVCSFDLANNQLEYAGANRPLWLVRNGELITVKPDKFPIGGLQMAKNRLFTDATIQLEKNDTIYIFTDGYADQFGGAHGKKMMTAKFRELLLTIQHMDMRAQEAYLTAHFENWKRDNEQVDDVLVVGIRI